MIPKSLAVFAAATGGAELAGVPGWAYMLATLVLGGGMLRYYNARMEKRLVEAKGTGELASAGLTEAKSDEIKENLRLSVLESVRDDMARQREETARALAAEKEAIAEIARLIADHTRDRADWREAKHDYENTIRDQDSQITILRREVEVLRGEVHTLRVALGVEQGRRVDDDRISHLEQRAKVSENRADRAARRADVAKGVAEEQEHRNDDTPGHA